MNLNNKESNLFYLDNLGKYKVANSDKDVRGWPVKDASDRVVGKVDSFLVNKNDERVVYLDVEVDDSVIEADYKPYSSKAGSGVHDYINEDGENHVIIPVGMAHLNLNDGYVTTKKIDHDTFASTKRIKKRTPIERDYEIIVLDSYNRNDTQEENSYSENDEFYRRKEFNT